MQRPSFRRRRARSHRCGEPSFVASIRQAISIQISAIDGPASRQPRRAPPTGRRRRHGIRIGRKRRIRADRSARGSAGLATAGRRGDLLARTVASRAAVPLSFQAARETNAAAARVILVILLILSIPLLLFRFPAPTIGRRHASRPVGERQETGWTGWAGWRRCPARRRRRSHQRPLKKRGNSPSCSMDTGVKIVFVRASPFNTWTR